MQNRLRIPFIKKVLAVILICCIFTIYNALSAQFLYAKQDNDKRIDLSFNIGDVGLGMLFKNKAYISFTSLNLLNFYIEDSRTKLGLKLTPFHYIAGGQNRNTFKEFSILNADIYWNPFPKPNKTAMMVPFAAFNYFTYDKRGLLDMSDITFSTGWRFVYIGSGSSMLRFDTYSEIGYRYFNNEHYYYLTLNLDIIVLAVLLLMLSN